MKQENSAIGSTVPAQAASANQRMQAFYRTLVFWKASALSVYDFDAGYSTHIVSTLG